MNKIQLIPIAFHDRPLLEHLQARLGEVLHAPVELLEMELDPERAFDASRKQYHSAEMLALLLAFAPSFDSKILGVTGLDLFVPILTFVFGQAQLNNRAAIFSTYRLTNEFYGIPPSRERFEERAIKEALHELGHTFGLRHCFDNPCAMNPSSYVEEIDLKPDRYCEACIQKMAKE